MLGPIYALFVDEIGGGILEAGITMSAFALAGAITTMISGYYADKIRENELIMVLGYALMGFGFLMFNFANSIWFLIIIQLMLGVGEAIYSPAYNAIYSKHLTQGNAGKEWGLWQVIDYLTYAAGAAIGGYIASTLGFNVLFTVMSIIAFSPAVYIYLLPRKLL